MLQHPQNFHRLYFHCNFTQIKFFSFVIFFFDLFDMQKGFFKFPGVWACLDTLVISNKSVVISYTSKYQAI